MYSQQFDTRHKMGLERFTGDNSGRVFANERMVTVEDPETGEKSAKFEYDVYDVRDARDPKAVKDAVISEAYPNGAEQKLLRQTVAKVLKALSYYDGQDYADFKRYNELCEAVVTDIIRGTGEAAEPTEAELLAKAKAVKVDEINEFDSSANVNAFTVNGIPMWLNFDLRSRLTRSIDTCKDETMTKYFGGIPFTYPIDVWRQMVDAVEEYADKCQTVTELHKAAVMALESVEDVKEFDITQGYPEKLRF